MAGVENLGVRLNPQATIGIIGGGWAGLAAAVTLAAANRPVTLYESAPQLGGRARRVVLHDTALDNGQHILIGAYRETLRLLDQLGVDREQAFMPGELDLRVLPDFHLRARALPAPFHLAAGLLAARGLGLRDKLMAVRFLAAIKHAHFHVAPDLPLTGFLTQHGQTEVLNHYLWHPLCLAALNTPPSMASAQVFVNVLRDAFFKGRSDSRLLLPKIDLGTLLPEPAARFIAAHDGTIHVGCRVQTVQRDGQQFILQHDHGTASHTHVICAVPPARVHDLARDMPPLNDLCDMLARYHYQPIYTVYLQYDDSVRLPAAMLGLSEGLAQWVFDRGQLDGHAGLIAAVISGEGAHQTLSHEALVARITTELVQHLNLPLTPHWWQIIAEKRATFSCLPGLARPSSQTAIPNFFLAGDYVASDYPATLEAAVRSGVQCARLILEN